MFSRRRKEENTYLLRNQKHLVNLPFEKDWDDISFRRRGELTRGGKRVKSIGTADGGYPRCRSCWPGSWKRANEGKAWLRAVHGIVVIYQVEEGGEEGKKESRGRAALTWRVLILVYRKQIGSATWYQMAFNLFPAITSAPQILFPLKRFELTNRENASFSKVIRNVMTTLVVPSWNSLDASSTFPQEIVLLAGILQIEILLGSIRDMKFLFF